jgi:hypothetical protein
LLPVLFPVKQTSEFHLPRDGNPITVLWSAPSRSFTHLGKYLHSF